MKYEVIGWSSFNDKRYDSFTAEDYNDECAARLAIIDDIRKNGYAFGGDAHQNVSGCAPVLNNGAMYRRSMREWGAVMAEAWQTPNEDGYAYAVWYMDDRLTEDQPENARKIKYPESKVDIERIVCGGKFDKTVPENYEPYGTYPKDPEGDIRRFAEFVKNTNVKIVPSSDDDTDHPLIVEMKLTDEPFRLIYDGIKTVEVRLNDEKRRRLQTGDIIQFIRKDHPEDHIRTRVVALYKFATFNDLFSSGLAAKTGYNGYTKEKAIEKMREYYDEADEIKYGVLAIEIEVLTK